MTDAEIDQALAAAEQQLQQGALPSPQIDPRQIAPLVDQVVQARLAQKFQTLPILPGPTGAPGIDGKNGLHGRDGKDGADGVNGKDGKPGKPGDIIRTLVRVPDQTRFADRDGSSMVGFIQSGTGAATRTMQEKGRDLVSIDDYSGATDAIKHTAAEAAMGTRTALFSRRFASDGLPNTENGAGWFRLEYADPVTSSPRAIDLSFYGFGQIFRFTGDGTTANNSRSVLEFWGADGVGPSYRPIMTLVVSATEHEVHVARDQTDVDAIICSYMPSVGPVIYTETGGSAFLDFGVQRLRLVRVKETNLNLVSGMALSWVNSTTDPGATADTVLARIAAGKLRFTGGDAELLIGSVTGLGASGYNGIRLSGTTGGFIDLMTTTTRISTIFNDATYAMILKSLSGTLPITFHDLNGAEQFRVAMTASAVNYPIATGAASGANASIKASAENLLFGSGSALATTATAGYCMFPSCAGTPTGVPTVQGAGKIPMIFDTTGVKLWFYTGGAWKGVVVA